VASNPLTVADDHGIANSSDRTGTGGPSEEDFLENSSIPWQALIMVSRVSHTTIDCENAHDLSTWWKGVLGYTDLPDDPNDPGDEECMIVDPRSGHRLLFIKTHDERRTKSRLHLDLAPTDRTRDEEVDRLVAHGARTVADLRRGAEGWVVMADPEGNAFCVLRSDEERAPSGS